MEKSAIREQVELEIKKWTNLQQRRNVEVSITPKAVDFLCLMIENIQEDKSIYWNKKRFEENNAQEFAISLIPNALNDLRGFRRFGGRQNYFKEREIKISSWEIWHSLSEIVDRFCFIPKDI